MKIIAVSQARSGSTRLPNKVLLTINDQSLLEIHLERLKQSKHITNLLVATTTNPKDEQIVAICQKCNVASSRGSEQDVLDRYYQAVKNEQADYIVRVTSDCPLIDAALVDKVIQFTLENKLDYGANIFAPHYPDGQDVEVFTFQALKKAWKEATLSSDREHVTPYIRNNSSFYKKELFRSDNFCDISENYETIRMTVDEQKDFLLIQTLIQLIGTEKDWLTYTKTIQENQQLIDINKGILRNEGYLKSLKNDHT
jgi:spore coat polysaccharide biosynthesis protein SpsF (cytidylyltransferase family)